MNPNGSKIVNPEVQLATLQPGRYFRLTVRVTAAAPLRELLKNRQLCAKKDIHDTLRHAAHENMWPSGEECRTVRVTPTDTFDPIPFLEKVWPHTEEGHIVAASPKRPLPRAGTRHAGETNRKRVR